MKQAITQNQFLTNHLMTTLQALNIQERGVFKLLSEKVLLGDFEVSHSGRLVFLQVDKSGHNHKFYIPIYSTGISQAA